MIQGAGVHHLLHCKSSPTLSSSLDLSDQVVIAFIQGQCDVQTFDFGCLAQHKSDSAGPLPSIWVQDVFEPAQSYSCMVEI